jgi:hypothetical protein
LFLNFNTFGRGTLTPLLATATAAALVAFLVTSILSQKVSCKKCNAQEKQQLHLLLWSRLVTFAAPRSSFSITAA